MTSSLDTLKGHMLPLFALKDVCVNGTHFKAGEEITTAKEGNVKAIIRMQQG